jgi:tyrosine-protein kinase Etk/Wzc
MERARRNGHEIVSARSLYDESYRTLRGNLQIRLKADRGVVLVSSPAPREGKSTVVLDLSVEWAYVGRKVLLVDGDLRACGLTRMVRGEGLPGLAEALEGKLELTRCVHPLADSLTLLPAGTRRPGQLDLLGRGEALQAIFQKLRETYDLVLVDSPPVLAVCDALAIAPFTDAVLLLARSGRTLLSEVAEARRRLEATGARVAGTVLTFGDASQFRSYQPYGADYAVSQDEEAVQSPPLPLARPEPPAREGAASGGWTRGLRRRLAGGGRG